MVKVTIRKKPLTFVLLLVLAGSVLASQIPLKSAGLVSSPTIFVSPVESVAVPGGPSFTVSIQASGFPDLLAYDMYLRWNASLLAPVGISDAGTVFEPLPHFTLALETGIDFAHVAATLLGTGTTIGANETKSLVFVTLRFLDYGQTSLRITDDLLLDSTVTPVPHVQTDGVARTPPRAEAVLVKWKARPDVKHFSISARGTNNTFFADVREASGVRPAYVRVVFTAVSATGEVSFAVTPVTVLGPGQELVMSGTWTLSSLLPQRYFVTAQLQISGDGITLVSVAGQTKTFSFTVVA